MSEKTISHNVFFELKDPSAEAAAKLISDCHKYLKPIRGIIYFAAGIIHGEHNRDVNISDYHVGTHITFKDQKSHDYYQDCDLHNEFISRNKDNWKSVRVFDWIPDYSG